MAEDLRGLQTELQTMKQQLLQAVAALREDVARIDSTTRETCSKVQYLCDHLLGEADQKNLRLATGKR